MAATLKGNAGPPVRSTASGSVSGACSKLGRRVSSDQSRTPSGVASARKNVASTAGSQWGSQVRGGCLVEGDRLRTRDEIAAQDSHSAQALKKPLVGARLEATPSTAPS